MEKELLFYLHSAYNEREYIEVCLCGVCGDRHDGETDAMSPGHLYDVEGKKFTDKTFLTTSTYDNETHRGKA